MAVREVTVLDGKMYPVEVELAKAVGECGSNEVKTTKAKYLGKLIVRVSMILYAYRYVIAYSGM
jgi:hypothetical protein